MAQGLGLDRDLQLEVERFLYDEADLLDERRFWEWLDLFTDDVRYWMPLREAIEGVPDGMYPEDQLAISIMDDDKDYLKVRVQRLDSGFAHAETPPSRTRHLITNVRVMDVQGDELSVQSNFHVYQSRLEEIDYQFFGKREDRLRKVDGQWRIAYRKIVMDHRVLSRTLSTFF